jgi:Family of unknown function (DUF5677)
MARGRANARRYGNGRTRVVLVARDMPESPDPVSHEIKFEEREWFNRARTSFEAALTEAENVSRAADNRFVETRLGWASFVFLKLCVAGDTLRMLCRSIPDDGNSALDRTLDHWSAAALARNMIEATVMFSYLSESGMSEEEWELRKLVLWNHDATTRYRMFKGLKDDDQAKQFKKQINDLRSSIGQNLNFSQLDADRREKINAGTELYVRGLRSVIRNMKWDLDQFDFIYAYLSSHTHSSPVSFLRLGEHRVDFRMPTDQQFALSALSLEWAGNSLSHATAEMKRLFPASPER